MTDLRVEKFVLDTRWSDLPSKVQERLRGCFIDIIGALVAGSASRQFAAGLRLAERAFRDGGVAAVGTLRRFSFPGAACAMGHAANAYDIDDGHSIIRAHPAASFISAVLAAAYDTDATLEELLTAMYAAYEITVRSGAATMDYYGFAHSSGTFGAVGSAVGAGRLYGLTPEALNTAVNIAEFNAPIVPGIRSVEYPSMNKDGVPYGSMTGALAVMSAEAGFTGARNFLEYDEYRYLTDDLGRRHAVMELYFKPYPCCRWAHPAIDACLELVCGNAVSPEDISAATVYTFTKATLLSKIRPSDSEEAQYNIAYPVAAAIVNGGFGIAQLGEDSLADPRIYAVMDRLAFVPDSAFDDEFPARRMARAEIRLTDGRVLTSSVHEPYGEACDNIGIEWLTGKFSTVTANLLPAAAQAAFIRSTLGDASVRVRNIVDSLNAALMHSCQV